jgi:hypothetical protein
MSVRIISSTSFLFRPTMVLMPNLALLERKRITVYHRYFRTLMSLECKCIELAVLHSCFSTFHVSFSVQHFVKKLLKTWFLRNFNYSDGYFATRVAEKFMSVGVLSGDSKKFTSKISIIFLFFVEYYLQLLVYYATCNLGILII